MKFLSLTDIKDVDDSGAQPLEVSEWGGTVNVRGLTGAQRATFEDEVQRNLSMKDIKVRTVIDCVLNEDGSKMFTSKDRSWITSKSASAIEKVFAKVLDISGIDKDSDKDAEGN